MRNPITKRLKMIVQGYIKMKKSQMQIMESIFVLIIFFFLLVFGLIFYASFSQTESQQSYEERMKLMALESAQRIQYMPELQCTKGGGYVKSDCVDLYKVESFDKIKGSYKQAYSKYFPNTLVKIKLVYPKNMQKDWVLYNYTSNTSSSGMRYHMPVSLYNATAQEHYFGYVMVEARY